MGRLTTIDLNADLGEGYSDNEILPYISSCNIACGGHIGDEKSVRDTIRLCIKNNVAIGAHPSYPDKENFGRKSISIDLNELTASIKKQIDLVYRICQEEAVTMHHIKAHGALYNDMAKDEKIASKILANWQDNYPNVIVYTLSNSPAYHIAKTMKINAQGEVFADRAYANATQLMSRQFPNAVLQEKKAIIEQVDQFLNSKITDTNGLTHTLTVDTICLHGDTVGAVQIAKDIYHHLKSLNVNITALRG